MMVSVLIMAVLLPMMLAVAFLLGRHFHRRQYLREQLSVVSRQHIDLFQGGQLNEALVESTKKRFQDMLERGEIAEVEASLRPGVQYVVQVRALTEIGTKDVGEILERQLQRRLSEDQLEQSWYWIDVANGLRNINRQESLPHLLRCADSAGDVPLGHYFAAETVCFLGFAGYITQFDSPLGKAALRVLHRALEGLRQGVPPHIISEGRLGEVIEKLWDERPERVNPLLVRVLVEVMRTIRRIPHAQAVFASEGIEQESFEWQTSRLIVLEQVIGDYLEEAPEQLCLDLVKADSKDYGDYLLALTDLRAETAPIAIPLLKKEPCPVPELMVESLTWSKFPSAGSLLRDWIRRKVPQAKRQKHKRNSIMSRPSPIPLDVPYRALLQALRGHPSEETEELLLSATQDPDPVFRIAAFGSLGWWEPVDSEATQDALNEGRRDQISEVRQTARAALARLGERQALQWFRHALTSENSYQVHEAIQLVATEGLTLLWPDLDRLADAENPDVAHHAREALERLAEEMDQRKS